MWPVGGITSGSFSCCSSTQHQSTSPPTWVAGCITRKLHVTKFHDSSMRLVILRPRSRVLRALEISFGRSSPQSWDHTSSREAKILALETNSKTKAWSNGKTVLMCNFYHAILCQRGICHGHVFVCVCLFVTSQISIQTDEQIELAFSMGASFDLSYTVFYWNEGISKIRVFSIWNFGLRKFRNGKSIVLPQNSSTVELVDHTYDC